MASPPLARVLEVVVVPVVVVEVRVAAGSEKPSRPRRRPAVFHLDRERQQVLHCVRDNSNRRGHPSVFGAPIAPARHRRAGAAAANASEPQPRRRDARGSRPAAPSELVRHEREVHLPRPGRASSRSSGSSSLAALRPSLLLAVAGPRGGPRIGAICEAGSWAPRRRARFGRQRRCAAEARPTPTAAAFRGPDVRVVDVRVVVVVNALASALRVSTGGGPERAVVPRRDRRSVRARGSGPGNRLDGSPNGEWPRARVRRRASRRPRRGRRAREGHLRVPLRRLGVQE